MRSIVGLALLMIGLSIGTYAYYPQTVQQHVNLANVTRVIAPVTQHTAHPPSPKSDAQFANVSFHQIADANYHPEKRNFSPNSRLFSDIAKAIEAPPTQSPKLKKNAQRDQKSITTASLQPTERKNNPKLSLAPSHVGWATVVTPAVPPKSGSRPLKSSLPADGSARYALVRDIQRELKRVGCYWGKIDGDWGPGSKRAIEGFIQTVNSALPTRDPDYILLALLRAQQDQACGRSQERSIIASRSKRYDPKSGSKARLPHRPRLVVHPRLVKRSSSQFAKIAPPPEPIAASRSNKKAQAGAYASRQPLPGRMAIGGPRPKDLRATETAPGVSSIPLENQASQSTIRGAHKVRKKKTRRHARVTSAKYKKKSRRKTYRQRRSRSPLRNLLLQGVH